MKKAKAIELLKLAVPIKALTRQEYADFVEAVNMGMDALKAQLSQEGTTSDLISRQAAIDDLFELYEYQRDIDPTEAADLVRKGIYLAEKKIEQLPSAQPELIEKAAYIRGFEQGRTQGMIDSQSGKK